jgi:hypothetical protein
MLSDPARIPVSGAMGAARDVPYVTAQISVATANAQTVRFMMSPSLLILVRRPGSFPNIHRRVPVRCGRGQAGVQFFDRPRAAGSGEAATNFCKILNRKICGKFPRWLSADLLPKIRE